MTAVGLEEGLLLRAILEPDDAAAWRSFECWRDLRGDLSDSTMRIVEGYYAVEQFIPDYVSTVLNVIRESYGRIWSAPHFACAVRCLTETHPCAVALRSAVQCVRRRCRGTPGQG